MARVPAGSNARRDAGGVPRERPDAVPGPPAEAGRTVFEGVVVFVEATGVPVVDFGPPAIVECGNVNGLVEMITAACPAFAG